MKKIWRRRSALPFATSRSLGRSSFRSSSKALDGFLRSTVLLDSRYVSSLALSLQI